MPLRTYVFKLLFLLGKVGLLADVTVKNIFLFGLWAKILFRI